MDNEKSTIEFYHDKGFSPYAITKKLSKLGINEKKIYRVCKRLRDGGTVDNRHRSGRRPTVRTPEAIKRIREQIRRKPQRSIRRLARLNRMSKYTVGKILKQDLGMRPYKKRRVQGLSLDNKKKRLERCEVLKTRHAGENLERVVFSDEKLFGVEEKLNSQNVRLYSMSIEDIPEELRTVQRFQNEKKVMVWCGISKKGKFPMVFIESGIRINARYYIDNVLESVVKEEGARMYPDSNWTFQQDSAPAHKEKITQTWLKSNLPNFISSLEWPPSSPDLNPLDYSIWGILEARVNARRHISVESLKQTLLKEWEKLSMEDVRAAIDTWPTRLSQVNKAKGGRFE